jgi:hypothetical protein
MPFCSSQYFKHSSSLFIGFYLGFLPTPTFSYCF